MITGRDCRQRSRGRRGLSRPQPERRSQECQTDHQAPRHETDKDQGDGQRTGTRSRPRFGQQFGKKGQRAETRSGPGHHQPHGPRLTWLPRKSLISPLGPGLPATRRCWKTKPARPPRRSPKPPERSCSSRRGRTTAPTRFPAPMRLPSTNPTGGEGAAVRPLPV